MSEKEPVTGADLKALRTDAGLTQRALAVLAGTSRNAVQYWERRKVLDPTGWAVRQFAEVLGLDHFPHRYARARTWGVSAIGGHLARLELEPRYLAELARLGERAAQRSAKARVRCEAKTRAGHPCGQMSEPGKRRCKWHGGKSTGPKTPEGKARIAEVQRRRWVEFRNLKGSTQKHKRRYQPDR